MTPVVQPGADPQVLLFLPKYFPLTDVTVQLLALAHVSLLEICGLKEFSLRVLNPLDPIILTSLKNWTLELVSDFINDGNTHIICNVCPINNSILAHRSFLKRNQLV